MTHYIARKKAFNTIATLFCLFLLFSLPVLSNNFTIAASQEVDKIPHIQTLVVKAYQNIGIQPTVLRMPANRSIYEAKNNSNIDAELVRVRYAEELLPDYFRLPVVLLEAEMKVYYQNKALNIRSWQQLKEVRVITARGLVGITQELEKQGVDYIEVARIAQVFAMLKKNRADVAVLPGLEISKVFPKEVYQHLLVSEELTQPWPLYHFIHKRHSNIVPKLTESLQRMVAQEKENHGS